MKQLFGGYGLSLRKLAICGIFMTIFLSLIFTGVSNAGDNNSSTDGKLITIHDRGNEKLIVTKARTIGDALNEAGITINDKDRVEPSVNEELVASDYQVNIYRARPVVVVDGNIRQKIFTPYQTADQIVEDAGIELYDDDKVTLGLSTDLDSGAGLSLVITRAKAFTFTLYGVTNLVRTQAATVGEMLVEKNINITSEDKISLDLNTVITEGMSIKLWREGKQTTTVDEDIAFDIEKIENADQPVSYKQITTEGIVGKKSVTYEITIVDGKEVSRTVIASIILKQPKKQVEVVGVKGQYTTPSENENIAWDFFISNGFSRVQTAGIMGNLMQEHHFNTSGDGIAQWSGARREKLYSLEYPNNIYTQLQFLLDELNGAYSSVRDSIKATNSLTEAVQIFQNKYEKCGYCREDLRFNYASDILASH